MLDKHNMLAGAGIIKMTISEKGSCGIADNASAAIEAVNANSLQDWYEFYEAMLK